MLFRSHRLLTDKALLIFTNYFINWLLQFLGLRWVEPGHDLFWMSWVEMMTYFSSSPILSPALVLSRLLAPVLLVNVVGLPPPSGHNVDSYERKEYCFFWKKEIFLQDQFINIRTNSHLTLSHRGGVSDASPLTDVTIAPTHISSFGSFWLFLNIENENFWKNLSSNFLAYNLGRGV